jgi:F-type H+-transporting ATPase subunit b
MHKLLEILGQLGLDQTVWIQLGFFILSYLFLSRFLFKPYLRNLKYRKKNTGGALNEAAQLATITERLAIDYQGKMKKQNEVADQEYSKLKSAGAKEEEKLVSEARIRANKLLDETKKKISSEVTKTKEELRTQIPQISGLIASRLLGRNL